MKKWLFPVLATAVLFMGCEDIGEDEEGSTTGAHNQGAACLDCHGVGGSQSPSLSAAGTVFTDVNANNGADALYASGHTIRLILDDTGHTVINFSAGNGKANSNIRSSISVGTNFTAQVLNASGVVVNSSGAATHDASRVNCNACHTAQGNNGAPGRIVSFDIANNLAGLIDPIVPIVPDVNTTTPEANTTTPVVARRSFNDDVKPILVSECKSCHTHTHGFLTVDSNIHSRLINGLVDMNTPTNSTILIRATNTHSGGVVFSSSTDNYTVIKEWIEDGALDN